MMRWTLHNRDVALEMERKMEKSKQKRNAGGASSPLPIHIWGVVSKWKVYDNLILD